MGQAIAFDLQAAHRHFAADCFNRTWELIERKDRTGAETEAMVLCAMASLWHWTQRRDCTDRNRSIGHWQVSRAWALAGNGAGALHHAERALDLAAGSPPFYIAYAHEAAARAAQVLGDAALAAGHLDQAQRLAADVTDAQERQWLEADLQSLREGVKTRSTA